MTPKVGKKEKEEEIENENASRGTASEVEPIPKAESSANADDEKGNVPTTKKNDDEGKSNKDETASEETGITSRFCELFSLPSLQSHFFLLICFYFCAINHSIVLHSCLEVMIQIVSTRNT